MFAKPSFKPPLILPSCDLLLDNINMELVKNNWYHKMYIREH